MIKRDNLISDLMQRVRRDLFSTLPEKAWYSQQEMVRRALTLPAAWLDERGVKLPAKRYRAIVMGILDTVSANRAIKELSFPSRYLWTVIESHMLHHGDSYYEEGKSLRNRVTLAMSSVERAAISTDDTVPVFAAVHRALTAGRRKAKIKAVATALQSDLKIF